ncbi:MAG: endopeptidase La [Calditrichaceae bacterium]|nr:endopeptidase La [Calditrichaceae bacterium]
MAKKKQSLNKQPSELNVLPLKDLVFFPHMVVPLIIGREQSIEAVERSMLDNKIIMMVAQRDAQKENITPRDLYRTGVTGRILQIIKLPNGLVKILVEGIRRAKVVRFINKKEFLVSEVEIPEEVVQINDEIEAKKRHLLAVFKEYIRMNEDVPEEILFTLNQNDDIAKLSDFIATYLDVKISDKQKILEKWDLNDRIELIFKLINKENRVLSLKTELDDKVRHQILKSQRNFYLQEQMRVIQEELGEEDEGDSEISFLRRKLQEKNMPQDVIDKSKEELHRLKKIPTLSPEYNVIRTYLEWLIALPWQERTSDQNDLEMAKTILDEDHYGLSKPKKRILEYIAVLQRVQKMQGPILCLAGPPGVGKTSLGKSIARTMGRIFVRMSLGGVHDEAEIRGHRRTYIGSLPGKVIQGMKKAGTINPVFLLDEVDKLGSDFRGDPSSALLEVLDPEQNCTFSDHYLEVEYDLSNVMFIVTANNPNEIPPALLDRMEVIELPGYMDFEKKEIAKRHLIAKQKMQHGLKENEISFKDEAIDEIILNYTLEAGVRNLEREISSICRKAVVNLSNSKSNKRIVIDKKCIRSYLGEPKYPLSKLISKNEIGVANGLAWTPYGGDLLRVEVNLLPGKDKLTLTGKLGEVMQESAVIALAYVRSRHRKFKLQNDFINKYEIHIHLPEGAVPKDGPSAGVTLTTALISALKKESFPDKAAMTGEITLRGRVLPVGGLNEKLLAAKRYGIKTIFIPIENKSDIKEMDRELYQGIEIIYVSKYDQIYEYFFGKKKSV